LSNNEQTAYKLTNDSTKAFHGISQLFCSSFGVEIFSWKNLQTSNERRCTKRTCTSTCVLHLWNRTTTVRNENMFFWIFMPSRSNRTKHFVWDSI